MKYLEEKGYAVIKFRAHGVLEILGIWANLKSLPPPPPLDCPPRTPWRSPSA